MRQSIKNTPLDLQSIQNQRFMRLIRYDRNLRTKFTHLHTRNKFVKQIST